MANQGQFRADFIIGSDVGSSAVATPSLEASLEEMILGADLEEETVSRVILEETLENPRPNQKASTPARPRVSVAQTLAPKAQTKASKPLPRPAAPNNDRLDFMSIEELIADELGELGQTRADAGARHHAGKSAATPALPTVEVDRTQVPSIDLGDDRLQVEKAINVYERLRHEVQTMLGMQRMPTVLTPIFESLKNNQVEIKEHLSILQDIVGNYIRQRDFQRVAAVDSIKRKLDELSLQMRGLENRLKANLPAAATPSLVQPESSEDAAAKAADLGRKALARDAADQAAAKARDKSSAGRNLLLALMLLALSYPAYYFSSHFGVQKIEEVDVKSLASIMPLERAAMSGKAFHGTLPDSWKALPKAEREKAVRDLAESLRPHDQESIFLVYKTKGIAVTYRMKDGKLHLQ